MNGLLTDYGTNRMNDLDANYELDDVSAHDCILDVHSMCEIPYFTSIVSQ